MALETYCSNAACRRRFLFPDSSAGRSVRCQGCGQTFVAGASTTAAGTAPLTRKPTPAPSVDLVGSTLGRFVVKAKLGAGAFGTVYRAFDPILDREVALKVPNPGVMAEPKRVERFLREAKAAAGLRHPHIVAVFDAGKGGDQLYIASAFIEGKSLADIIPEDGADFGRAARLVRELAEALAYAHEQGVVHRDVKPANIMVDARDRALLMDFGLATRQEVDARLTTDGALMGTPAYMAPEQATGQQGEAKVAVDQYAAGVVLYELLTGRPPFEGPAPVVLHNVLNSMPESPRKLRPGVPRDLETICLKAMAKHPALRYPDCQALADDLRRWQEGDPIAARPMGRRERLTRWFKKDPKLAAFTVVTPLLLVLVVTFGILWHKSEQARKVAEQQAQAGPDDSLKIIPPEPRPPVPMPVLGVPAPKKLDAPDPKKSEPVISKKFDPFPPDPKKGDPDPKGGAKADDLNPLPGAEIVGKMETPNVIVLSRAADPVANWIRLDPAGGGQNAVHSNSTILALPGFKADVKLDGVTVHLWGNVPEQVSIKSMVMQSRVRFHPPAGGLDGDLTLDTGRVYLTTTKPGARVRVRVGTEVWDVTLRDEKTDVLIQASLAFVPGTPYLREGGQPSRTEARLVVIRGAADVNLRKRYKVFDALGQSTEIVWDSKSNSVSDPHPAQKDELFTDRNPPVEADRGRVIQRTLNDAVKSLTGQASVRVLVGKRVTADLTEKLSKQPSSRAEVFQILFPTQWAIYSQAAVADGPDAGDLLKDLIDLLRSEERWYARQAAVVALSAWIGQKPGNTELLVNAMLEKGWLAEDADLVAKLLRGHSSADMRDPAKLDELVTLLEHPLVAVRQAALGNLFAFYGGLDMFNNKALVEMDVSGREVKRQGADEARLKAWEEFLNAWKAHAKVIKKRMAESK